MTTVRGCSIDSTLYSLHRRRTVVASSDPGGSPLNPKFFRNGIVMLVLVVGTAAPLFTWIQSTTPSNPVGYSQFLSDVRDNKVANVVQQGDTLTVKPKTGSTSYTVTVPSVLT